MTKLGTVETLFYIGYVLLVRTANNGGLLDKVVY